MIGGIPTLAEWEKTDVGLVEVWKVLDDNFSIQIYGSIKNMQRRTVCSVVENLFLK